MHKALEKPIVFVDVETNGSPANRGGKITDIACIRFENGIETDRFVSLVNPQTDIPRNIQQLTGITPSMVASAPKFREIAPRVERICKDAIFSAHNVHFDYTFIRMELLLAGRPLDEEKLCTAKLSRRLYPEYKRHNLLEIIERFGLTCSARHRALGDTEVLVQLADQISKDFSPAQIRHAAGINSQASLPWRAD